MNNPYNNPGPPQSYSEQPEPGARASLLVAMAVGIILLAGIGGFLLVDKDSGGQIIDELLKEEDSIPYILTSIFVFISIFIPVISLKKADKPLSAENKRAMVLIVSLIVIGAIVALGVYFNTQF